MIRRIDVDRALYSPLAAILILLQAQPAAAKFCVPGPITELAETVSREILPFDGQCLDASSMEGRPEVSTTVPVQQQTQNKTLKTKDLLRAILSQIREYNKTTRSLNVDILKCQTQVHLQTENERSQCQQLNSIMAGAVPMTMAQARYDLARSFSKTMVTATVDTWSVNRDLSSFDSYRGVPFAPMTQEELSSAQGDIEKRASDAIADWEMLKRNGQAAGKNRYLFLENQILSKANEHFENYRAIVTENPYLLYMPHAKNIRRDLPIALQTLIKNIDEDDKNLDEIENALDQANGEIPPVALNLLKYRQLVKQILDKHPQYCGLATSLEQTRLKIKQKDDRIFNLALIAVSLAVPPVAIYAGASIAVGAVVGVAAGLSATGAQVLRQEEQLNAAIARNAKAVRTGPMDPINGQADIDLSNQKVNDTLRLTPAYVAMEFVPFIFLPKLLAASKVTAKATDALPATSRLRNRVIRQPRPASDTP